MDGLSFQGLAEYNSVKHFGLTAQIYVQKTNEMEEGVFSRFHRSHWCARCVFLFAATNCIKEVS